MKITFRSWSRLLRRRRHSVTLLIGISLLLLCYSLLSGNLFLGTCMYSHKLHRLFYGSIEDCFFMARSPMNIPVLRDYVDSYTFLKNHENVCGTDFGASLPLLLAVTSGTDKAEARAALRSTWGGGARHLGVKMLFFMGLNDSGDVNAQIRNEDSVHGDIIQSSYIDTYVNLTLKTVSIMKWVSENCNRVHFVLKVDDDMFVNIERLLTYVGSLRNVTRTIIGRVTTYMIPFRHPSKWNVPWDVYPEKGFYPPFTRGGAYLFTGDAAEPLYRTSLDQNFLNFEDVSLTGIAARSASIVRVHQAEISDRNFDVLSCGFREMITSHGHTPQQMEKDWAEFNSGNSCKMSVFEYLSTKTYKLVSWLGV